MTMIDNASAGSASIELARIAIVMPSCDRYSSLWPISLAALERYWPGRPRATYLIANRLVYQHPGVTQVLVGDDVSWSDNLKRALDSVAEEYVFLALDDLVMLPGTNAPRVNELLAQAVREGWDYLRMNPLPPPTKAGPDGLGRVLPGEAYRAGTVWSLWRKSVLQAVLLEGENPWQFEKIGSTRTDHYGEWWASAHHHVPYLNVVTSGKSEPDALAQLAALGFDTKEIAFPVMSRKDHWVFRLRRQRSRLMKLVPTRWRRMLLQVLT